MQMNHYMAIWNASWLKMVDIRRIVLEQGEEMPVYKLPVSAFFYFTRGSAHLLVDG